MAKRLFTSESVTEGHPDKIADAISDAVLDSLLSQDPKSRVACETLITTGQVHVAGEVTTDGYADVMGLVRETVLNIGYDSSEKGFDGNSCGVSISIGQQSPDIAKSSCFKGSIRFTRSWISGLDVWVCHSRYQGTNASTYCDGT